MPNTDQLNRLTAVNYGDGETQSYGFDNMGNRLVKMDATASGTVTTNSTYDIANRLTAVGGASYTNDANGNTLTGGGRTMTWDSQNRMVSCTYNGNTLTFDYGSDGLRRSETLTSGGQSVTTYYVYDGQSLVMEETKNAQGVLTPSASYLNGPRGPEYKKDETTGLVKWYLYDGLGSVIGEVDPSGNVTYSAKYDVYGAVRATSGTATSAQGFVGGCGHLSEAATGLIYMRARYYDPNTGRFVSEDSKGSGGNWYWYADGNPVNNVDVDGKDSASDNCLNLGLFALGCHLLLFACCDEAFAGKWNPVFAALVLSDCFFIAVGVNGLGLPNGVNAFMSTLATAVGIAIGVMANESNIAALEGLNGNAASAAVGLVTYGALCETWETVDS